MLQARYAHAVAFRGDDLYIFGGISTPDFQLDSALYSAEKIHVTKTTRNGKLKFGQPKAIPDMLAGLVAGT